MRRSIGVGGGFVGVGGLASRMFAIGSGGGCSCWVVALGGGGGFMVVVSKCGRAAGLLVGCSGGTLIAGTWQGGGASVATGIGLMMKGARVFVLFCKEACHFEQVCPWW